MAKYTELQTLLKLDPNDKKLAVATLHKLLVGTVEEVEQLVSLLLTNGSLNQSSFKRRTQAVIQYSCNIAQHGSNLYERTKFLLLLIEQHTANLRGGEIKVFGEDAGNKGGNEADTELENVECNEDNAYNSDLDDEEDDDTEENLDMTLNINNMNFNLPLLYFIVSKFKLSAQIAARIINQFTSTSNFMEFSYGIDIIYTLAKYNKQHHLQMFQSGLLDAIMHYPDCILVAIIDMVQPIPVQFTLRFAQECIGRLHSHYYSYWQAILCSIIKCGARASLLAAPGLVNTIIQTIMNTSRGDAVLLALFDGQGGKLLSAMVNAGININNIPISLKTVVSDFLLQYAETIVNSRDTNSPWYITPTVLPASTSMVERQYTLISAQAQDISLVKTLYGRQPIPGYEVKDVKVLPNEHMLLLFSGRVNLLEERHNSKVFSPWWNRSGSSKEQQARTEVMELFNTLSTSYARAPHVSFLPLWYGAHPSVIRQLQTTGFANLAALESGQFGKGFYFGTAAEYAFKKFNTCTLLIAWVAAFSPFPVVPQDNNLLAGKANHENYDVHFAPVFPNSLHQHTQLVVFESTQMLPHYLVELRPNTASFSNKPDSTAISTHAVSSVPTIATPIEKSVDLWSAADVSSWVSSLNLSQQYKDQIAKYNINGRVLSTMKKKDWLKVGVQSSNDVEELLVSAAKLQ